MSAPAANLFYKLVSKPLTAVRVIVANLTSDRGADVSARTAKKDVSAIPRSGGYRLPQRGDYSYIHRVCHDVFFDCVKQRPVAPLQSARLDTFIPIVVIYLFPLFKRLQIGRAHV